MRDLANLMIYTATDGQSWIAASSSSPFFCLEAGSEREALALAARAALSSGGRGARGPEPGTRTAISRLYDPEQGLGAGTGHRVLVMSHYVEIQGIYEEFLEFAGYVLVDEDDEFQLFVRNGQEYLLPKSGLRFLQVDHANDADLRQSRRRVVQIPR